MLGVKLGCHLFVAITLMVSFYSFSFFFLGEKRHTRGELQELFKRNKSVSVESNKYAKNIKQ